MIGEATERELHEALSRRLPASCVGTFERPAGEVIRYSQGNNQYQTTHHVLYTKSAKVYTDP